MLHKMSDYVAQYTKPITGLATHAEANAAWSAILTFFYGLLVAMFDLIATPTILVTGLCMLIGIDTLTGIYKVIRVKGWRKLSSFGYWAVGAKLFEYLMILGAFTVLSNMDPLLKWVQVYAFLFMAIRETWSIGENLYSAGAKALVDKMAQVMSKKVAELPLPDLPINDEEKS